jgi:hypothetical protein
VKVILEASRRGASPAVQIVDRAGTAL